MLKRLLLALFLVCVSAPAWAQGCGSNNPNCIVPTRPAGDSTHAAASTAFVQSTMGQILTNPTVIGDTFYWSPASSQLGMYFYFLNPYFQGVTGANPSGSFGFEFIAQGKPADGSAALKPAIINPGAASCATTVLCWGDIDFIVRSPTYLTNEIVSLYGSYSGAPGGFVPGIDNHMIIGTALQAWKYMFAHAYYVQDATLPTLTLNNTTPNGTETIAYQNNGSATFGLNGYYSGGANNWGLYDTGTTGGASYDITQISNGATTIQPYGAIYLSPRNGYVISSQLIVAPDVELTPVSIATLLTISCGAGTEGTVAYVKDTVGSAAPTFHLTVAGGGANAVHSLASCNGTNWQYD